MQAYSYHPVTKIFSGEISCQKSPLEEGVYLLPANATVEEPPVSSKNEIAVFVDGAWSIVPDYRGKTIYHERDSRETDIIKVLGAVLPDEWTMVSPPDNEKHYVMIDGIWQEYQKTSVEILAEYDLAMENYLKTARIQRGYTTREPSDYISSAVDLWRQDAIDWIAFRDAVLTYALNVENTVTAGGTLPTLEEFTDNMPQIVWTHE